MRFATLCLSSVIAAAVSTSTLAAIDDPVRVAGGLIAGVPGSRNNGRVFKGIPYAAPPIGDLRWRPPQPVAPWQGVRKTDAFSLNCTQMPHKPGSFYQVEYYREEGPS